jgi:hypothetical protein
MQVQNIQELELVLLFVRKLWNVMVVEYGSNLSTARVQLFISQYQKGKKV